MEASRAVENQAIEEANEIYRGSNSATAEEERREAIDAAQLVKAAADTSAYDTYNEAVSSAYEALTSTTSTLRSGFEDAVAAIEGDYQTELTSALDQYQSDVSEAETQYAETIETVTSQYASALSSYQSSIQGVQSTFTDAISSAFTEFLLLTVPLEHHLKRRVKRWHHSILRLLMLRRTLLQTLRRPARPSSIWSAYRRPLLYLHTNWHLRRASPVIGQMR